MLLIINAADYFTPVLLQQCRQDQYVTMAIRDIIAYTCDLVIKSFSDYDFEGSKSYLLSAGISHQEIDLLMTKIHNAVYQIHATIPRYVREEVVCRIGVSIDFLIVITDNNHEFIGM